MMMFVIFNLLIVSVCQLTTGFDLQNSEALTSVLKEMQVDPMDHMNVTYPVLTSIPWNQIEDCYVSSVGASQINIFNDTIVDIIREYFREHYDLIDSDNVKAAIKGLISNMKELIDLIFECVKSPKNQKMKLGLTSMSHYSDEEYESLMNPLLVNDSLSSGLSSNQVTCDMKMDDELPDELDWNKLHRVTPVRNQRHCGSCYIFSAIGALESQFLLANPSYDVDFSEQAVLDCNQNGCHGGWMNTVWEYLINNGITNESADPYVGKRRACQSHPQGGAVKSYCWHSYRQGPVHDDYLRTMLYKFGPLAGALDARNRGMKYVKDVFNGQCSSYRVSHAILIVGYTPDHWIIKNSWGKHWGNRGFFKLPRKHNKCGINLVAGVPFIEDDYNDDDDDDDNYDNDDSDYNDGDNTEDIHEDNADDIHVDNTEDIHEDDTEDTHEDNTDDIHEDNFEDIHEDNTEDTHEDNFDDIHEDNFEDIHEDNTEDTHEDNFDDIHEDNFEDIHEDNTEDTHEDNFNDIHEDKFEDIHEDNNEDNGQKCEMHVDEND